MKKLSLFFILITIFLVLTSACIDADQEKRKDYEKCTQVCAAVVKTDSYVTLHLCNEECKQKFLNST